MMRLGRRKRSLPPGSEPPIFSDDHSMGGGSNAETTPSPTFAARIIVTDGANVCSTEEPAQETTLDTTLGLEDCSDSSSEGYNELVIITSAVIEPSPDDLEAPVEVAPTMREETKHEQTASGDNKGGRAKLVLLCIFVALAVLAAMVAAAHLALVHGDDKKTNQDEDLIGLEPTLLPSVVDTAPPSGEDTFDTVWDATDPSSSPSNTLKPTEEITASPSEQPSHQPTTTPSQSPTSSLVPTLAETSVLSSNTTSLSSSSTSFPTASLATLDQGSIENATDLESTGQRTPNTTLPPANNTSTRA